MRVKGTIAVLGALALLAAAPSASGTTRGAEGKRVAPTQNVFVTNTAADAVPTSIVGTPNVSIAGTPSVSILGTPTVQLSGTPAVTVSGTPTVSVVPAQTPFQQIVFASTGGGGEDCVAISVPSGKILTIQSFAAVVNRNGPLMPAAYIRVDASLPSSTSFRRPLQLDLRPAVADDFAGDAQTLLISGAVDPNGYSFAYDACVIAGAGTSATMSAVVSGYLTNA